MFIHPRPADNELHLRCVDHVQLGRGGLLAPRAAHVQPSIPILVYAPAKRAPVNPPLALEADVNIT